MNWDFAELTAIRDGLREVEVLSFLCASTEAPGPTKSQALRGIGAAIGTIREHLADVIEKEQSAAGVQS